MGTVKSPALEPENRAEELTVCLVGMPNAGKTTLMNALTGGSFHTANYPGATATILRGKSKPEFGPTITLVDLPGVHSPVAPSPEEELSCRVLEGRHPRVQPDVLLLVVDATQLERHLKFAGYAARQGKPMVVALTMTDLLARTHQSVNDAKLSAALGVPVVPVDPRTGKDVERLIAALRQVASQPNQNNALAQLPDEPVAAYNEVRKLLTGSGALAQTVKGARATDLLTARIDRLVLHRYLGFPIFFIILAGLFAAIFWAAQPFMDGVEGAFAMAGKLAMSVLPEGVAARFIGEGIIQGVGAVAVFFPQIVILFFLMTLLEDSGYLARGAALVDRPLSFLGLHGRSFVPMLSGFACAIPAIFAARTIPARRERMLTIWILPLMSCSARLPVYALLLAALLPDAPWKAGLSLAGIYITSLLAGSLVAGLISRIAFRKRRSLSILAMELPVYRTPQLKPILRMTWKRASAYLKRAGVPIVVISSVLWLLSNFGLGARQPASPDGAARPIIAQSDLEHSFAAQLGQAMEPMLRPMGVDWRVGVGLISAFAAREVFVSSMAIVFHVADSEETQQAGLLEQMRAAKFADSSQRIFTPATILGLIAFFFFSLQCLSTVSVIRSETNSWRMAGLQLLFYTGLGYLVSVTLVQGLRLMGVE